MDETSKGTSCISGSLREGISLQLCNGDNEPIFESSGKWLYPLFEVEDYLHAMALDASELFLHDRIAGRAAASLITRMGFENCFIDTISSPAAEVFKKYNINFGFGNLVDRIACKTEELITAEMDINHVYMMLRQRAGRLNGIDLEVRSLFVGYEGSPVLRGLNLEMRAGDHLVISGDSGTGKTTLLKCLARIIEPAGGEILLDGLKASVKKIPSQIGYINQGSSAPDFPITAAEVVASGFIGSSGTTAERNYQIEIAMRRTGCFELSDRNINTLSGGEKQRVSLARCLALKAGLILMDEPTSFLDSESKEELLDVLNNVVRRHMPTVIIVSRDHEWIDKLGWPVKNLENGVLC